MEQRVYHGNVSPEGLAEFLLQRYLPQEGIQVQKIGEGNSLLVQIGHGKDPAHMRHAVTIAIAAANDQNKDQNRDQNSIEPPGIVVTMGQRQWITPSEAEHAAFWGLLAILITPWVLFALLWPLSEMISSSTLPDDVWNAVDLYAGSQGVAASETQLLTHPHLA